MARDLRVKVRLTADTKDAERNANKASSAFGSLFSKLAGAAAVGVIVAKAFRAIAKAFTDGIAAAQVQEDAIAALDASLVKLGPAAAGVSKALQDQASALQRTTRFGDEATISAQAQLAIFTQNETELKNLTIAAQDFATAQGIDLVSASQLLGKTLGSSTNALIRYGVQVDGAANSSERAASIVDNLSELFGGRAVAAADTYSGALERLSNAQGDVLEQLGNTITASTDVRESTTELAKSYENLSVALDGSSGFVSTSTTLWNDFKRVLVDYTVILVSVIPGSRAAAEETRKFGNAAFEAAAKLKQEKEDADALTASVILMADASKLAESATNALSAALGTTTSLELERQIFDIVVQLEIAKEAIGGNTDEFVRLEEAARQKIDSLRSRIDSLRDGFGDLADTVKDSRDGFTELGDSFQLGSDRADVFSERVRTLRGELDQSNAAAEKFSESVGGGGIRARFSFNQAAVDAALAAGNRPFLNGTRIRTLDGGSVLIDGA